MDTEERLCFILALPDTVVVFGFTFSISSYIEIVIFLIEKAFNKSVITEHDAFVLNDFSIVNHQPEHGISHWDTERETFDGVVEQFLVHVETQSISNDVRRCWKHCA